MSWFAKAACAGADPNIFFPTLDDTDNHGRQAKAICATCPVRTDCLVDALQRNEDSGIWGGAGEDLRRSLGRALTTCTHDPLEIGCDVGCRWCGAVRAHFAILDGERTAPVDRNGPGATHGRRVTYNRGCRCGACCFAVQIYGAEQKFDQRTRSA